MKKRLVLLLTLLVCFCASCDSGTRKLDDVANLSFEDELITFDEVEGAEYYAFDFYREGELVFQDEVDFNMYDLAGVSLDGGEYSVRVTAVSSKAFSEGKFIDVVVLSTVDDVIFEAENGLYNWGSTTTSCYRNNPLAHEGAYVGGLDDAGQGLYFYYFNYIAGEYDFECYYTTALENCQVEVVVNGKAQGVFKCDEVNGWGGLGVFDTSCATTKIYLEQGWNTINIIKNGNVFNDYGGFVELDYFILKGTEAKYNVADYANYDTTYPPYIRLEAELGCPLKIIGGYQTIKNPAIANSNCSNGFILGAMDEIGDGVEWHFRCDYSGKYEIKVAYAHDNLDTENTTISFFLGTKRNFKKDRKDMKLDAGIGWENVLINSTTIIYELEEGQEYFIYATKQEGSCSFQIDYIDLIYLGE